MNNNNTTAASPCKLRNGSWGAKTQTASVQLGDIVTITTRAGKSWDARVTRVVWTGDSAAIVATESLDRPQRRQRSRMGSGHGAAASVRGYSSYCTDNEDCGCFDCV